MTGVQFPNGFRLERLERSHPRRSFQCGDLAVHDWLRTKALQQQVKKLSVTTVLLDPTGEIASYYTLATGQVDCNDLPPDVSKGLPRRQLPVAVLAWLGVAVQFQGQGLGASMLANALNECRAASTVFPFVAVILDCQSDAAKSFYIKYDFRELPGRPYRLFLSAALVDALATDSAP